MNRYAAVLDGLLGDIDLDYPGYGVLVVPPRQHELVAQVLEARWPGSVSAPLRSDWLVEGPARWIVTGVPRDRAQARVLLSELNGRRDWNTRQGRLLLLLLSRYELAELQRSAGDVYSVCMFTKDVPFVPDPQVDAEAARAELARWMRERFGRLDLRGFVRSESEDVSWRIEDLYQDVRVSYLNLDTKEDERVESGLLEVPLVDLLQDLRGEKTQPVVVLGHPGSGKTFFLRWLAITLAGNTRMYGIEHPLPLLTSLSAYAQAPGPVRLRDYLIEVLLESEQPAAHVASRALLQGQAVILLDGLDEVGDEAGRRRIRDAVAELVHQSPGCLVIVTSRITGYDSAAFSTPQFTLAPFDDDAIKRFLVSWCELYARDRLGDTPAARAEGRTEGERLAQEVFQHQHVRELARNPLLLTVLALVHRTGVRLPDHRVEFYEHATRVLVERWNQVRSLSGTEAVPPLKAADAVRLLGPVALGVVSRGTRGAVEEDELRRMLQRTLAAGNLKGVTSADDALELFRTTLGLLVEQGPGLYSFLHLTLAEYFTAWELVRSEELENLAADPGLAFQPEWREVLLLACGILGVLRADDARMTRLIGLLLESARKVSSAQPPTTVPAVLAGILADDPGLPTDSARSIIQTLIPDWWFKNYYNTGNLSSMLTDALMLMKRRLSKGRFSINIQHSLKNHYSNGLPHEATQESNWLARLESDFLFLDFTEAAGLDEGAPTVRVFQEHPQLLSIPISEKHFTIIEKTKEHLVTDISVSKTLDIAVRSGKLPLQFTITTEIEDIEEPLTYHIASILWGDAHTTGANGSRIRLRLYVPFPEHVRQMMPQNSKLSFYIDRSSRGRTS